MLSEKPKGPRLVPKLLNLQRFPVVGIGASAGGLEAFAKLLENLRVDTGMAFVLIQHLDPNHESLLGEILARATKMPVVVVKDGEIIKPNHVYVMPSDALITIDESKLNLVRRGKSDEGPYPIDYFFLSLARERKDEAIGVVLSGTGSDGVRGLMAIQVEGGITFAQDQKSAKFDGMPKAAASCGVDYIMSPEEIAHELARMIQEPKYHPLNFKDTSPYLKSIFRILAAARNVDFSQYKIPTIQRRISRRMATHQISRIEDYVALLNGNDAEINDLYESILIKVTEFFRTPESFEALKNLVFPTLLRRQSKPNSIRIWVPGCATGEEAYSIAICLLESMESEDVATQIEIFATDISEIALATARAGYYDESHLANVSLKRLKRFFIKEGLGYRVSPSIREICIFAKQNVAVDPPFSKIDLISCRNLLIYLKPSLQERVLTAFHFALNADGYLALGKAEKISAADGLFQVTNKPAGIFSKKYSLRKSRIPEFAIDALGERITAVPRLSGSSHDSNKKFDVKSDADQAILKWHYPSAVVIDEYFDVIQFRGDTSPFLLHPPGDITTSLFKMCRDGLMVDLRSALQAATVDNKAVQKNAWIRNSDHHSVSVFINVIPFTASANARRHFVVTFALGDESKMVPPNLVAKEISDVHRLELELSQTKEYLNAIIEKEQASNEELKSASEEILSANEELQSTNEEMATAKEEIQATNEELITVNEELENRLRDLYRVNNDLTNLFAAASIPILLVFERLCIRRFTQTAELTLNLTSNDVGKSLAEIETRIGIYGLEQLTAHVIETLNTLEQEIQDNKGCWYSLRIKPYRTLDNKIDGAVISLLDIDLLKRSLNRVTEAQEYAEAIVETSPVALLVLDSDFRIVTATETFCRLFQVELNAIKNTNIYALGKGQWNSPKLRHLLEEVLPTKKRLENYVVDDSFSGMGRRVFRVNARRLVKEKNMNARVLLAIVDITEEKQSQEKSLEAKNAAQLASQSKSDFLANMSHEIRTPLSAIFGYSELLANPNQTKSDALQSICRIQKNIVDIMELVDEILDISKIEAGKLEVERIRCELLPELSEIFILLDDRAKGRGLSFNVTFEGSIPKTVLVCPSRLRQILFNLVGNALKFTTDGGVTVRVKLEKNEVESASGAFLTFFITDTGCGISLEQQDRLFRHFSQADASIVRKYGGSGLGLLLSRRLAEALGGGVYLENSGLGQGSTFVFRLDPGPLDDLSMMKGIEDADLKIAKDASRDVFSANQRLKDIHVLLVEDSFDIQMLMKHMLEASGAIVSSAINGAKAIMMATKNEYDVVLMDMQMPVLDGYEATKQLRAKGYMIPIIALTANAMRGERDRCLAIGCVEYISKPVKANHLIDIVERFGKK